MRVSGQLQGKFTIIKKSNCRRCERLMIVYFDDQASDLISHYVSYRPAAIGCYNVKTACHALSNRARHVVNARRGQINVGGIIDSRHLVKWNEADEVNISQIKIP